MTIYVVVDEYWNYSDTDFQIVKAYADKNKATKIVARANRRRDRLSRMPYNKRGDYSYRTLEGQFNIYDLKVKGG